MLHYMATFEINQIISYREMCNQEKQEQLQRGMNFECGGNYSVILMSVKNNAPYADRISVDGQTIYYEGHDLPGDKLKSHDQPISYPSGKLTQNGLFKSAIDRAKLSKRFPLVRVYEKLQMGIWNYRGLFEITDYEYMERGGRRVFEYILSITDQDITIAEKHNPRVVIDLEQTRQIPGTVKLEVFKRDKGQCIQCGSKDNLHFDHILPYSLGGTSLKTENIQLLCARHNLSKSAKLDY